MAHYTLIYDFVADYLERREAYRGEHLALVRRFRESGLLKMAGAYAEPADAALLLFEAEAEHSCGFGNAPVARR